MFQCSIRGLTNRNGGLVFQPQHFLDAGLGDCNSDARDAADEMFERDSAILTHRQLLQLVRVAHGEARRMTYRVFAIQTHRFTLDSVTHPWHLPHELHGALVTLQ